MAKLNPVELAAEIVAAFVSNNPLPKSELPALIHAVHLAVERLAAGAETEPAILLQSQDFRNKKGPLIYKGFLRAEFRCKMGRGGDQWPTSVRRA